MFYGCYVFKTDPNYTQGLPDLLVLYEDQWATLECKKNKYSSYQPNQKYYVEDLNSMSFSAFIFPENKDKVLHDLQLFFKPSKGRKNFKLQRMRPNLEREVLSEIQYALSSRRNSRLSKS